MRARLQRIERSYKDEGCPECGFTPGAPIRFVLAEPGEPLEDCTGCGFPLTFTLRLGEKTDELFRD